MEALRAKFPILNVVVSTITGATTPGVGIGSNGLLVGLLKLPILGPLLAFVGIIVGGLIGAWAIFRPNDIRSVYSFNWNVSDAEIKKGLETRLDSLYSTLGESVGTAVGWFACGVLPGALTFFFNPVLASVILKDVGEEMADEVWGEMAALQHGATQLLGNAVVAKSFMSARRFLKKKDSPLYSILKNHFGDRLDKWGNDGQPSWSFQKKVEEKIETIDDPKLRNFTEEFVESVIDSCISALQRVGQDVGTHLAANAMMQKHLAKSKRGTATIQLDFSRDDDGTTPAPAPTT